jgi:hypothetical protein
MLGSALNCLKIILRSPELDIKFLIFSPIPYTWIMCRIWRPRKPKVVKTCLNTSKHIFKSKQKKNFRFLPPYLIHGSCDGFGDLENQNFSKHILNPLKIIFRPLETKKKFSIFPPIPYTLSHVSDLATSKTKSRQNMLKHFKTHF